MKLLSIVFSFRNEEGNIEPLVKRISTTMDEIKNWKYELIFVNDDSTDKSEKIETERNELIRKKLEIEKKNQELMREHKYLKGKIAQLQEEVNKRSYMEEKFNQDIEELSQETENLVNEIEKWQT